MKYYFTYILALFFSISGYSQSINDFKYVVIPKKFEFLKFDDQYQLNSLTQFLFTKYGFTAYVEGDEGILELADKTPCNTLYANVISDSNFIQSRLKIEVLDCNDQQIFITSEGKSKEKDYRRSYHNALREAFLDIESLQYKYDSSNETPQLLESTNISEDISPKATTIQKDESSSSNERLNKTPIMSQSQEEIESTTKRYTSQDGFYIAQFDGNILTFYEGQLEIGTSKVDLDKPFEVVTSQFTGLASFNDGRLVIERKIKGITGTVNMIFLVK